MVESILEIGDFVYVLVLMELGVGLDNNSVIIIYMCKNGKVYINGQKIFIIGVKEYLYMLVLVCDL